MTARWSIPIQTLAEKVKLDIETVARKATFDLFTAVAQKSPVDTGRFRANWNVSFGAADVSITDSTNTERALAEASKALTLPLGGVTYMSNGLPYARTLEYGLYPNPPKRGSYDKKLKAYVIKSAGGFSRRAASGMVRISAQEFGDYVNKAISS